MQLRDRLRRWWNPAQWRDDHPEESDGEGVSGSEAERAAATRDLKKPMRYRFKIFGTGGMPDGTGISPTGTPIDFTAERPPQY